MYAVITGNWWEQAYVYMYKKKMLLKTLQKVESRHIRQHYIENCEPVCWFDGQFVCYTSTEYRALNERVTKFAVAPRSC